jgi:hypothetical protein
VFASSRRVRLPPSAALSFTSAPSPAMP